MANVCCAIELEPRTLKGCQLNDARVEAADVAQKMKPSDAKIIFIEGLKHVGSIKKMKQMSEDGEEDHYDHDVIVDDQVVEFIAKKAQVDVKIMACQCTCSGSSTSASVDDQDKLITEPLSAPF